jgi:predicted amidohydrolase YtcJ
LRGPYLWIGSIEVGKYADIAVWDKDLLSVPVEQIKELRCELTLMNRKIVHQAPDSPIVVAPGRSPAGPTF